MALAVKVCDVASAVPGNCGLSLHVLQLNSPTKLQDINWRHLDFSHQFLCTAGLSANLGCGRPLLRSIRTFPFKPAALPLDRSRENDEGGASEPWVGAVIFKRSAVRTHYEFHTSLERLGLGFLSTESSRNLAISMGLSSGGLGAVKEEGTPVNISIDVSREGERNNLRLEGIARTTLTLCCNRCLAPMVERVFADFSLLLSELPVSEPTQQRIGVVLGNNGSDDDKSELDIDLDDKLYFPREAKEMDLSKYLHDTVHLEIPSKSLCSNQCLGLCLTCGINLNQDTCNCVDVKVNPSWGPLDQLKKQIEGRGEEGDVLQ